MKTFKRMMTALDLSTMDKSLLTYSGFIAEKFNTETAYFVHIEADVSLPRKTILDAKSLSETLPADEACKARVEEVVKKVFPTNGKVKTTVEILEGKPYEKLIHWEKLKQIDLLVVGKKEKTEGSGIVAKKVARVTKCDVLFVTPNPTTEIQKILVPIDFSENSARALKAAIYLSHQLWNAVVECVYVFDVPSVSYYQGPNLTKQLRNNLQASNIAAYKKFLEDNSIREGKLRSVFVENTRGSISKTIGEYIQRNEVDFVITGAQGHTGFESFLFGSVTEGIVKGNTDVPILVIR